MAYDLYPAVDDTYNFPVEVRRALAASNELKHLVIPMTTTLRNNLTAGEKWDGRTIANTTTDRLERYDVGTAQWYSLMEYDDVKAYAATNIVGRNVIINGNFHVMQRGIQNASVIGNFVHDRWTFSGNGGTLNYSSLDSTADELPEGPRHYACLTVAGQAASADTAYLMQRIEYVTTLQGKKATISFWAKASVANSKVSALLVQVFGPSGSPAVTIKPPNIITIGTTWQRYSVTIDVPSIAGKTIGTTGGRTSLELMCSSGATGDDPRVGIQNGTFSFWGVQIEEGPVATAFENELYSVNLAKCKRYYTKYGVIAGMNDGVSNPAFAIPFLPDLVAMRYPVVVSVQTVTYGSSSTVVATNPVVNGAAGDGYSDCYISIPAGHVPAGWLRWNNVQLNAELT